MNKWYVSDNQGGAESVGWWQSVVGGCYILLGGMEELQWVTILGGIVVTVKERWERQVP